jgi:hypothetical protein
MEHGNRAAIHDGLEYGQTHLPGQVSIQDKERNGECSKHFSDRLRGKDVTNRHISMSGVKSLATRLYLP